MNELRGVSVGDGPSAIIAMSESRSPKSPRTTTVTPFTTRNGSYSNKSNSPRSINMNNQEYVNSVLGPRRQRSIPVKPNDNDYSNNNHVEAEIQFSPPYASDSYKRVNSLNDSNPDMAFRTKSNHSRHEHQNQGDSREGTQLELSAGQDVVEEAIILRRRSTSRGRKVDRVKSSEEILSIQRNSLGTGRKKHGSHHSGTSNASGDSNSRRQERKIFSLDQVYIPSTNDSNSKINNNSDRGSGRKLGDSNNHNSYNSSQDLAFVTSMGNDNEAGGGSYNNSKSHNSYNDIDFVRPDIVPLSTPEAHNNRNSSPQSPRQRQQHSSQGNHVNAANVVTPPSPTSSEKLNQPHSPKRVLPKHHHQVFPLGGGGNTAVGTSFANRNAMASQRKKREKNRLTQYTNTTTTVTSSTSNNNNSANATNGSFVSNSTTTNESFKTLRGPPTAPLPTDIPARAIIGKEANSKSKISPQTYLDTLIRSRGYPSPAQSKHSNTEYNTQQPNSSNKNRGVNHATIARRHRTEFDQASFGFFTVGVARLGDCETLQTLLAAGLSPNACNENGESLARIVCRRGDFKSLQMLLKYGCDVDTICDDYGRNLLHDVCCCLSISSCLATVKVLLDHCNHTKPSKALSIFSSDGGSYDIHSSALRLFFKSDNSGALPLSYVRQEHWGHWLQFLAFKKDEYLPESSSSTTPISKTTISTPAASSYNSTKYQHEAVTLVQPLPVEVARMVASGKLPPEQARRLARNLYGKQHNQSKKGNTENESDNIRSKTKNTTNSNSVIISNMRSNSPKSGSKTGDGDASSRGATTLKTIPVPKDQESKFRDIIFYVENTVIRKREKRISRKPDYNIHYDNDIDSTAYPDSVSGVEFYCDSYHYKRHDKDDDLLSTSTESASGGEEVGTSSPQSDQSSRKGTGRYIAPSDDVDSTAYPDSVSGVEFYSEPYIPNYGGGYYDDNGHGDVQDHDQADLNDIDSTAFPDSVSGVEFYSDTMPRRYEKYNRSRNRSDANNPRENGPRGHQHNYPINLQTNYQPNRNDRSSESRHEHYNDEKRRQSYVPNNHDERSNESHGYSYEQSGGNKRTESTLQQHYQNIGEQDDRHYADSPGLSNDRGTSNYDAPESSRRHYDDYYEKDNNVSEGQYYEQTYDTCDRQTEIYHERLKGYDNDEQHSPLSPTSFLAASFSTEFATTCSVNDQSGSLSYIHAQQSNKKKNQQSYKMRQKNAQRYIRSMMDEDNSASANSDSERCVGGSSFSSLLEI